jgi:Carboxypeptidase regulatory-like domain
MRSRFTILLALICALGFITSTVANSQTATGAVSGTVKDPNGAVIVGAQVAVRSQAGESRNAVTDNEGRFRVENLAPGRYAVNISREGFKMLDREVVVDATRTASIEVRLEVAAPRAEINVGGKGAVALNSEPNYRELRDGEAFETYAVNNLAIKRDVGTITLRSGHISFLPPVMDRVVRAVFVGEGEFTLTAAIPIEQNYLRFITGKDFVSEAFTKAVFCFTDDTYKEVKGQAQAASGDGSARNALRDFQKRVRFRTERPRSLLEYLVAYEGKNLDAEILADLLNPKQAGFFSAYIFGKSYNDLRFHVRPRGAMPQMLSPEEVALLNIDPHT